MHHHSWKRWILNTWMSESLLLEFLAVARTNCTQERSIQKLLHITFSKNMLVPSSLSLLTSCAASQTADTEPKTWSRPPRPHVLRSRFAIPHTVQIPFDKQTVCSRCKCVQSFVSELETGVTSPLVVSPSYKDGCPKQHFLFQPSELQPPWSQVFCTRVWQPKVAPNSWEARRWQSSLKMLEGKECLRARALLNCNTCSKSFSNSSSTPVRF